MYKRQALHERSFDLHEQLAGDLGLASYRKIKTMEVTGELGLREWPPVAKATEKPRNVGAPAWLDDEDTGARLMDPDTAQVVPRELCEKLFERSGATLVVGAARGLETADAGGDARVTAVSVEDGAGATTTVPCDVLVCAMGVWSVLLEDWLGAATGLRVPLEGVYSSSVVFAGDDAVKAEPVALFCAEFEAMRQSTQRIAAGEDPDEVNADIGSSNRAQRRAAKKAQKKRR